MADLIVAYIAMQRIGHVVGMFTYRIANGKLIITPLAQGATRHTILMSGDWKNKDALSQVSISSIKCSNAGETFFDRLSSQACLPALILLYTATMSVREVIGWVELCIFPMQRGIMTVFLEESSMMIDVPVDWRALNRRYPLLKTDTYD
jgi:hypothetical protein